MLKEACIEVRGKTPRRPLLSEVYESESLVADQQASVLGERCSALYDVRGKRFEVIELRDKLADPSPFDHVVERQVRETSPRGLTWYRRWERPEDPQQFSVEHLVLDRIGAGALVRQNVRPGRVEIRLSAEDGAALDACVRELCDRFGPRFQVERSYAGDYRSRRSRDPLSVEDRSLLERAVQEGYFESPRNVSLSELSDRLGMAKSTLSKRLRSVEQQAVEAVLGSRGSR